MSRYNPRLAKIHRTYAVEDIAMLFKVHKNTVRHWVKQGLPTLDKKRPMLFHGSELFQFLQARRTRNKKTCKPGEIYCVRCREPRFPVEMKAIYQALSETQGNLIGVCPNCDISIYRRVSLVKFSVAKGDLHVTLPVGLEHINESEELSLNSDFKPRGKAS